MTAIEQDLSAQPQATQPIIIGEITDVPTPGSFVAASWAQEVTRRIIHRFATAAARSTAFTAPNPLAEQGMVSFLRTADATFGPEWYDGKAWRKAWNLPWGRFATLSLGANVPIQPSMTTVGTIGGPFIAGRLYRTIVSLQINSGTSPGTVNIQLADQALVGVQQRAIQLTPAGGQAVSMAYEHAGTAVAQLNLRATANASQMSIISSGGFISFASIDDIGPAAGPP